MNVLGERVADLDAKSPAVEATHAPVLEAVSQSALATVVECSPRDSGQDQATGSPLAYS